MGTQAPLHRDRHPGSACRSRHRNPTASTTRHARHGVEPDRHQAMKTWPAPSRMGTGSCHEQQSGAGWPGVRVQPGVRRRKTLADCPLCHHGRRHDRLMGVQCLPAALLAPLLRVTPTKQGDATPDGASPCSYPCSCQPRAGRGTHVAPAAVRLRIRGSHDALACDSTRAGA